MSLYPSLEDLKIDQMARTQEKVVAAQNNLAISFGDQPSLYVDLGLEELMSTYGGLDITPQALERYMPHELAVQVVGQQANPLVAITPANDLGISRAQIKQGVREVQLAKDQTGKFGISVAAIDKGLFVAFVWQNSAAAMAGVRFGDQILQMDGVNVAGWKQDKALKTLKDANPAKLSLILRDRPFDRTLTVVKDSLNQIGFVFKHGEITAIVKDSSAARNGILINHQLVEVNGQNVVGMKDKDLLKMIQEAPPSVTLTIMPSFLYQHLIKNIGFSKISKFMDHSIPEY